MVTHTRSVEVMEFYTRMSDYVLLACFFAPLLSGLYYTLVHIRDQMSGPQPGVTPDGQLLTKEQMRVRDEEEEAGIKARAEAGVTGSNGGA